MEKKKLDNGTKICIMVMVCAIIGFLVAYFITNSQNENLSEKTSSMNYSTIEKPKREMTSSELIPVLLSNEYKFENFKTQKDDCYTYIKDEKKNISIALVHGNNGDVIYFFYDYNYNNTPIILDKTLEENYSYEEKTKKLTLDIWLLENAISLEQIEDVLEYYYKTRDIKNVVLQEDDTTLGKKNALKSAKSYLRSMSFSYNGLIKQLKYEGYTDEECTYAVDNCGADWNEQASKCAKSYINSMSFSRVELLKQLKYEGFTDEQAEYGAKSVGY